MSSTTDHTDLKEISVDRVLDCKGEVCPYPVTEAKKALSDLEPGEVLEEVTDHSMATITVPEAVEKDGLAEVLGIDEDAGLYRIYLRKT